MPAARALPVLSAAVLLLAGAGGAVTVAGHPTPPDPAAQVTVTVAPGDTLSAIAAAYGTDVATLAAANGLADPDRIVAGARLTVPGDDGRRLPSRWHTVAAGETLASVAAAYRLDVATVAAVNGLARDATLQAGQRLATTPTAPPDGPAGTTVTVAPGDTLSAIAAAYGTDVATLAAANGLADPDRIVAGARLTVPGWRCPVDGPVTFVDDFGFVKPSGRVHEGVDLQAPRGTPVVAPVAGTLTQRHGERGGRQSWLTGADGTVYVASHLDRLVAADGPVAAGQVLGTVGTSGNAAGTAPHVHFELHPGGAGPASPVPLLTDAC